jgi:hypothetical protein
LLKNSSMPSLKAESFKIGGFAKTSTLSNILNRDPPTSSLKNINKYWNGGATVIANATAKRYE